MTPETRFKNRIKRRLDEVLRRRKLKHNLTWNAGTGYGKASLDCTGVIAGHPVAIEVKRDDGKGTLTTRQKMDVRDYELAGAFTMVVCDEASLSIFLAWVEILEPRTSHMAPVIQALMEARNVR